MAEVEGLTHSGICATDLPESEDFYTRVLGAKFSNRSGFHVDKVVRGRSLNTVVALADYLLALMVPKNVNPQPGVAGHTGANPLRHGFSHQGTRCFSIWSRLPSSIADRKLTQRESRRHDPAL